MPNWVMNIVKFGTSGEEIDEIKKAITDDEGNIDFDKIIPMPKHLNLTSGTSSDRALDCYRNGKDDSSRKFLMEQYGLDRRAFDAYYELGKVYEINIQEYGYPTWYEWRNENWGTKWNASETHWDSDNIVTFETAWACPIPILEKISDMYPGVQFEVAFADEDLLGNNCGLLLYTQGEGAYVNPFNGEGVDVSPFSGEEEAIKFAQSIWDGTFEFEGE